MANMWCKEAHAFNPNDIGKRLIWLGRPDLADKFIGSQFWLIEKKEMGRTSLRIDGVPSQCGMMFVHEFYSVHDEGLAVLHDVAKTLGYSKIQVTLSEDQKHIKKVLEENGWKTVDEWVNARSGNTNYILTKDIEVGELIDEWVNPPEGG